MDRLIKQYIIICETTSQMLNTDGLLKSKGIHTELLPTPGEYGSICTTAIAFAAEDKRRATKILEDAGAAESLEIFPYQSRKLAGLMNRLKDQIISPKFQQVMEKIESGEDLTREEIVRLLKCESTSEKAALFQAADQMRKEIIGDTVEIRGAIEFSNYCKKECNYCGIRNGCTTPKRYRMTVEEVMEQVYKLHELGIKTVILQSGEDEYYTRDILIDMIRRIKKETKMGITLSIGERSYETYRALREAGANNFLLKIETTNPQIFNAIHPDDDFDTRVECSRWLKELGYANGSGNMIGLPGQTEEDIAGDILFFKKMRIHMIGIGPFIPAKGTPFEHYETGSVDLTLKAVAVTRLVCKNVYLPATTALASIDPDGQTKALMSGANTIMLISTPDNYRENYQIYSNKNMVDLTSALKSVAEAGRQLPKYLKIHSKEVV